MNGIGGWSREKAEKMNSKDKLYANYVSTHIAPRKGKDSLVKFGQRTKMYQKRFGKFLPKDKSALIIDLGCGNGNMVWWLDQLGYANASGIDISLEQVDAGRSLGLKNVCQGEIKEFLHDKKDMFTTIFAIDIIEHFNKEDIAEILPLCYTSLKDNGIMIIQVPNAESPFFGRFR
jgi:2-polyprenyl-3-methyl-5-hydroxy-6-metoxy-1,4-benzoquinol methylase